MRSALASALRLALALAALAPALAPAAGASSPEPPFEVRGEIVGAPAVGTEVTLSFTVDANTRTEPQFLELAIPSFVEATPLDEWPPSIEAGASATRSWRLVARDPGLWTVGLQDAEASFGWCCLYAMSQPASGAWATGAEGLGIQAEGSPTLDIAAVDASTVRLTYTLERGDWLPQTRALVTLDDISAAEPAPAGERAVAVREVALASGNTTVVTRFAAARTDFEGAGIEPATWTTDIECVNMELAREGDEVRVANEWSCYAMESRSIPVPPWAGLAALASTALAAQRLSRRRA